MRLSGRLWNLLGVLLVRGGDGGGPSSPRLITQWIPHVRQVGPAAVGTAAGIGITNALAEEALWRGVPIAVFPDDALRGWLWPALGFTAWHLVPVANQGTPAHRQLSLLAGAALIGLGYGWIAQQSGPLRVVNPAHALTDSCGVRHAHNTWLTEGA